MKCDSPALQQALLTEARAGAPQSQELALHLASCLDCQSAVALLGRAREHQSPELGADELLRLRLRVLPRLGGQAAQRSRRVGLVLAFAIVGSAAVSLAAAGTYLALRAPVQQLAVTPKPKAPALVVVQPVAPTSEAVPRQVEPQPPVAVPLSSVRPSSPAAPPPSAKSATAGLWSDAASALKSDDLPAAERAFGRLAADSDQVTRDSAQLALAEIWLKHQQVPRARTALAKLSRSGATPAIRERAASLLAQLPH